MDDNASTSTYVGGNWSQPRHYPSCPHARRCPGCGAPLPVQWIPPHTPVYVGDFPNTNAIS